MDSNKKKVGNYTIDLNKLLGKGSYAEVYVATEKGTKKKQLKRVKQNLIVAMRNPNAMIALDREIEALRRVKSPHVIEMVEHLWTSHSVYIFQELAQKDLRTKLKEKGKFSEEEAIDIIIQLLHGFEALNNEGIIHRDIKPENIFFKDGVYKIGDFGLSRPIQKIGTPYSHDAGTPCYMAPQLFNSGNYNYKCDIWSLGVLLYELVVGTYPWDVHRVKQHSDFLIVIQKKCKNGFQFPQYLMISDLYKDLMQGCLKYKEEERFDWDQIYNHKIFKGHFKGVNTGTENFTAVELRNKVHQQNINLNHLIDSLPQKLQQDEFVSFLKVLKPDIAYSDAKDLFKALKQQQNFVSIDRLKKYFQSKQFDLAGFKYDKKNHIDLLLEKLSEEAQKAHFAPYLLKQKFDQKGQISKQEFHSLIHKICPDLIEQQIAYLFLFFNNGEENQPIPFNLFYGKFCQTIQMAAIQHKEIYEGLVKLEERKKSQS